MTPVPEPASVESGKEPRAPGGAAAARPPRRQSDAGVQGDSPPIERRGLPRDAARLLVADDGPVVRDDTMRGLPRHLSAGDLLVVNLSATLPAALEAPGGLLLHLATPLPDGDWLV